MEVELLSLWLPAVVASIVVFIAGFVMHMVLPHHRNDFARIGDEERFSAELQSYALSRGQYVFPFASSPVEMKDPAYQERVLRGPVGMLVLWPNVLGPTWKQLALHFVHVLVVSIFVAYIAHLALEMGSRYLAVFQVVGAAAFMTYAGSLFGHSIWYYMSWRQTWMTAADGLLYALLTAGIFGWLWPGS